MNGVPCLAPPCHASPNLPCHATQQPTLYCFSSGTKFVVRTQSSQVWLVYTMTATEFVWDNKTMTATAPTTVRLASAPWVMRLSDSKPILDKYSSCIPMGGKVSIDVDDKYSSTSVTWNYKNCAPLILGALCSAPCHLLLFVFHLTCIFSHLFALSCSCLHLFALSYTYLHFLTFIYT